MEGLGIDIKLLIAQIVNFAIFFFVFSKFIAKPFLKYLHSEKKKEIEKNKLLDELEKRDEETLKKETEILKKANKEAVLIIENAKKIAEQAKEEIMTSAHKEVDDLKEKAMAQLKSEKDLMYSEVKQYIVKTSSDMTQKVLREFLNEEDQKKITEKMSKKLTEIKIQA